MARSPRRGRVSARAVFLALLFAAIVVLFAVLVPVHTAVYGTPLALSFLLGAALGVAPLLALTQPGWAIALFGVAAFVLPLAGDPALATEAPWPWSVPAMLLFILFVGTVTFRHGARVGAFPLVIGVVLSVAVPLLRPEGVDSASAASNATADLIVTASLAAGGCMIAALIAARMRVSEELSREREHTALEQSRRALVEERARIARELHDVIAHSMSVIQVQASTARYRITDLDETAASEFDAIAATARTSLTEMRRMLGVLRTEDQAAELTPQQDLSDISLLIDSVRRAGAGIGLVWEGSAALDHVSPTVQIAAYRIVQEALSNAVRHAPGSLITVRVRLDDASLRLRVSNEGAEGAPSTGGAGYGLRGMQERAALLGGTLSAGPDAHGGWSVDALLPLTSPSPLSTGGDAAAAEETT